MMFGPFGCCGESHLRGFFAVYYNKHDRICPFKHTEKTFCFPVSRDDAGLLREKNFIGANFWSTKTKKKINAGDVAAVSEVTYEDWRRRNKCRGGLLGNIYLSVLMFRDPSNHI